MAISTENLLANMINSQIKMEGYKSNNAEKLLSEIVSTQIKINSNLECRISAIEGLIFDIKEELSDLKEKVEGMEEGELIDEELNKKLSQISSTLNEVGENYSVRLKQSSSRPVTDGELKHHLPNTYFYNNKEKEE